MAMIQQILKMLASGLQKMFVSLGPLERGNGARLQQEKLAP
ncbi:MAG TPA: hypothetical protein VHP11_10640 [Tepidisphaeraceae bacterium]|nr:hypothetical protein [Tepidisphaeraceae bacterium]